MLAPAYLSILDCICREIGQMLARISQNMTETFQKAKKSRNNGNHGVSKLGLAVREIDCRALMELLFLDICIWFAHF